jgi:hypothetical protein
MIDDLKDLLGFYKADAIARRLNRKYGTSFNATSVHWRTRVLGLVAQRATGQYTIWLAAEEFGVNPETIRRRIDGDGIKATKSGYHRFLSDDSMAKLREVFAVPPEPCVNVKTAARLLGIRDTAIRNAKRRGSIRCHKQGGALMIPVAEIERYKREREAR